MKYRKKFLTMILGGLLVQFCPELVLAHNFSDTLGNLDDRAKFMTGCLTGGSNFTLQDEDRVYSKMRACMCFLSELQIAYTDTELTNLFQAIELNDPLARNEIEQFVIDRQDICF